MNNYYKVELQLYDTLGIIQVYPLKIQKHIFLLNISSHLLNTFMRYMLLQLPTSIKHL
jgi:hypothetical protein